LPITGDVVSLASSAGNADITAVNATTDGLGVATFTVTDAVVETGVTFAATDSGPLDITSSGVDFTG
jgi:hypothetical protein